MNISERTVSAIQEMVHESFVVNATLDRMKTILSAKLAYMLAGNEVHKLAHRYAINMGDGIGDLIEKYNIPVIYGNIPLQSQEYASATDIFNALLETVVVYQNKLNMCAKIAFDNMDLHTYKGLMDIIGEHDKYVAQCIVWKDMAEKYGSDITFDVHIKDYNILD